MGPRPEGHGESDHRKDLRLGFYALQWGHVQKDMERDPVKGLLNLVFGASMGPRPEGHGEDSGFRCMSFVALASMGPRPEGHGEKLAYGVPQSHHVASMGPRPEGHGEGSYPSTER